MPGTGDRPIVNPSAPTRTVPYVCSVPRSALSGEPAKPVLYGHGLLGSRNEAVGGSPRGLRRKGYMPCAVDWAGVANGDLFKAPLHTRTISLVTYLADQAQQGFCALFTRRSATVPPH